MAAVWCILTLSAPAWHACFNAFAAVRAAGDIRAMPARLGTEPAGQPASLIRDTARHELPGRFKLQFSVYLPRARNFW